LPAVTAVLSRVNVTSSLVLLDVIPVPPSNFNLSDANDTAAEDARLIGVKIFYTTDAANDA